MAKLTESGEGILTRELLPIALDGLPNTDLAQGLSMDVYPVGDCANPFNIGEAICTANAAARTI